MTLRLLIILVLGLIFCSAPVWAIGGGAGGQNGFGFHLGLVTATQGPINTLIKRANARAGEGPISTSELNSAYEVAVSYTYRFSGTVFALHFRPSYFYQVQDGSGNLGSYKYDLQGYTIFPMFRLYPMENDFMKFFMQIGLGYGQLNGKIQEGPSSAKFSGGGFGTMVGMGTEFCFSPNHCLSLEGDYRYLTMQRNIVDSTTNDFQSDSIANNGNGSELETDGADLATRMGGLMFMLGYQMWF